MHNTIAFTDFKFWGSLGILILKIQIWTFLNITCVCVVKLKSVPHTYRMQKCPHTPPSLHVIMTYKDACWPHHVSTHIPAHTQPHPCNTHTSTLRPQTHGRDTSPPTHSGVSHRQLLLSPSRAKTFIIMTTHTHIHTHALGEGDIKQRCSRWCVKTTPSHHTSHILYVFPRQITILRTKTVITGMTESFLYCRWRISPHSSSCVFVCMSSSQ